MIVAAFATLALSAAAGAPDLTRLPGWDAASASAGCLAMASSAGGVLPAAAATPQQVAEEGAFWSWRLATLAPEDSERLEYWEAAHEWLDDELRSRDAAEARDFLAGYRGLCIIERATIYSDLRWEAAR